MRLWCFGIQGSGTRPELFVGFFVFWLQAVFCFLHLLQPVVFVFLHLLQPVANPLSPGHAWLCWVILDALCLWGPALVLKKLRVCRLREWLAKPLQKLTNKILRQFLALTRACKYDPRGEQSSSWYKSGADRLAQKCRLLCPRCWDRITNRLPVPRQDIWDYTCTPFLLALITYALYFWIQESSTYLYHRTILHYPWLRGLEF